MARQGRILYKQQAQVLTSELPAQESLNKAPVVGLQLRIVAKFSLQDSEIVFESQKVAAAVSAPYSEMQQSVAMTSRSGIGLHTRDRPSIDVRSVEHRRYNAQLMCRKRRTRRRQR